MTARLLFDPITRQAVMVDDSAPSTVVTPLPAPAPAVPALAMPEPASGPSHRLTLSDPSTLIMLATWLLTVLLYAANTIPGVNVGPIPQLISGALAVITTGTVPASKHALAGKIALGQLARASTIPTP
jgi:hypothetical protein